MEFDFTEIDAPLISLSSTCRNKSHRTGDPKIWVIAALRPLLEIVPNPRTNYPVLGDSLAIQIPFTFQTANDQSKSHLGVQHQQYFRPKQWHSFLNSGQAIHFPIPIV